MRLSVRSLPTVVAAALAVPLLSVLPASSPAQALDNGLARTPQMGWNDWNTFGCSVSDSLIRDTADALVANGMAAAGYEYVNIDDCWSTMSRDSAGDLVPDPNKFPHGMKALADYVHAKGLKFGLYAEAGSTTCAGYPGSLGHETQDAKLFASWGVDYLKYDNCGDHGGLSDRQRYTTMRDALAATGRPILFAMCQWGGESVWTWGMDVGNSWRTTGDISASWGSIMGILDAQVGLQSYSGPGGWNDPDMLEVGVGSLTETESKAHFSLWALLNAPLLAGNDLRTMSASTLAILTNRDVIAVDQDWGGVQGHRIRDDGDQEVWIKPMSDGSVTVALLNRGGATATISTTAAGVGLASASSYTVRDLWARTSTTTSGTISASVPSHGAALFKVTGGGLATPTVTPTVAPTVTPTTSPTVTPTTSPTATPTPTTTTGGPGPKVCSASYQVASQWPGGYQGTVSVRNAGATALNGWTVTWTLPGGHSISQLWSGGLTTSGSTVAVSNLSWNGALAPSATTAFGFISSGTPTTTPPTLTCSAS